MRHLTIDLKHKMVKKGMKGWKTIKFEEFGGDIANADFEGLAGFEECYEYGVESSQSNRKVHYYNAIID